MTAAGPDGVNLRAEPSASAERVKLLRDGAQLEIMGEDRQSEGRTWRNVKDPSDGATGWVAAEFVLAADAAPAAPKPVAPAAQPTAAPKLVAPAPQPPATAKPAPPAGGATIVCRDGYVWPGTTRQGACSGHGGIAP